MMKNLHYVVSALLCTLLSSAIYAGVLKGNITDDKGEPLPFATVYVKGSTVGTAANANAEYNLPLQPGTYSVVCQYMGFQQAVFKVTITGNEEVKHNFKLSEQSLTMKDVVVKANAEDPAYAIIRKAIKRRKFHQEQVQAFQTSIYMKAVIRNRTVPTKLFGVDLKDADLGSAGGGGADSTKLGVMYLSEQEADYYSKGNKERTIIKTVRESGNPNGLGLSRMPPVVSFYNNNVNPLWNISERGFVSPIAEGALNYYKYKYEGEFRQDGYTINKITVTPKRTYEPTFTGTIYIVDNDWAVHSLSLTLTKQSSLQQIDTLRIEQTYLPLKKDTWVIKSQVQYPTLKLFGFDFNANFQAVYDNQKINEEIPDSLFDGKIVSSYLKEANDKDTGHWAEARTVPLEADEVEDYHKRDSVHARITSPQYRDSMRRLRNKLSADDIIMSGVYYAGKDYKNSIQTNALLNGLVNYNTVEGLLVNPKIQTIHRLDTAKYIYTSGALRYGFGNTHFNAYERISYKQYNRQWLTRNWEVGVEGGKYVYQFNPNSTIVPLYNTYTTLLEGNNIMKLYERYTGAAFFNANYGNGLSWSIKGGFQRRLPVDNTTFYTWAKKDKINWTPNMPAPLAANLWEAHNAVLIKASVSFQPGFHYVQYPKFKSPIHSVWPTFTASYEKGIPNILNSKTDFDKWRFSVEDYVNMKLLGSLEYNLAAGGFLNSKYASLPDMMHVADNQLALASPYLQSFQLMPYYMFSNTAGLYGEAHVEYNLNGLLTNKIPLLKKARWNLVAANNTLYINPNNYYTEVSLGIDNLGFKIFRFLRVDVVRGWDHNRKTYTGIRIGIDGGALAGLGGTTISEDKENFTW